MVKTCKNIDVGTAEVAVVSLSPLTHDKTPEFTPLSPGCMQQFMLLSPANEAFLMCRVSSSQQRHACYLFDGSWLETFAVSINPDEYIRGSCSAF